VIRREGESLLLDGPVTFETVPDLVDAADEHLRQGARVIDFGGVTEVDSSAVALALEWLRRGTGAAGSVRLKDIPEAMLNLAKLYGVADLLPRA
jgi:phospholipid transport system transporter-binding protein